MNDLLHTSDCQTAKTRAQFQGLPFRTLGRPVQDDEVGMRLDAYLAGRFRFQSRSAWQRRVETGEVLLNGVPAKASARVRAGDQPWLSEILAPEPEVRAELPLLFQESGIMAVHKGGDLPMHENGRYRTRHVAGLLTKIHGDNWAAVHRLDKETSGIVLCADTPNLRAELSLLFCSGKIHKEYLAIVHGVPAKDYWTVDAPIGDRDSGKIRIKKKIRPDGLPAVTEFFVIARGQNLSLLRAVPLTGRTNQIRIHAAYSGHHMVGDKLYHPDEKVFLNYFDHGTTPWVISETGHWRLCLHAHRLCFIHPVTQEPVEILSPLPSELAGVLVGTPRLLGTLQEGEAPCQSANS